MSYPTKEQFMVRWVVLTLLVVVLWIILWVITGETFFQVAAMMTAPVALFVLAYKAFRGKFSA